jgi:hypothetical protein
MMCECKECKCERDEFDKWLRDFNKRHLGENKEDVQSIAAYTTPITTEFMMDFI